VTTVAAALDFMNLNAIWVRNLLQGAALMSRLTPWFFIIMDAE